MPVEQGQPTYYGGNITCLTVVHILATVLLLVSYQLF